MGFLQCGLNLNINFKFNFNFIELVYFLGIGTFLWILFIVLVFFVCFGVKFMGVTLKYHFPMYSNKVFFVDSNICMFYLGVLMFGLRSCLFFSIWSLVLYARLEFLCRKFKYVLRSFYIKRGKTPSSTWYCVETETNVVNEFFSQILKSYFNRKENILNQNKN